MLGSYSVTTIKETFLQDSPQCFLGTTCKIVMCLISSEIVDIFLLLDLLENLEGMWVLTNVTIARPHREMSAEDMFVWFNFSCQIRVFSLREKTLI